MRQLIYNLALAGLVLGLATGCQPGKDDLEQWVAEELQRPGGEIEPIPPISTPEVVAYDAYDLRDPFRSRATEPDEQLADEEVGEGLRPDPERRREYLEEFSLDALAMVGTLEIEGVDYALVRDPERVVHRVREGNYMGTNYGRVTSVEGDRIEMVELHEDGRGGWVERETRVRMRDGG